MGNVPVVLETVRNIPAYDAGSVSDPNLDGQRWRLSKALTDSQQAHPSLIRGREIFLAEKTSEEEIV
jgi:hypothetical protein